MTFLLGLDIGSTVIKAVLFDVRGRVVRQAASPVPVERPRPGWVERDAEKTWRIAAAMMRRTVTGRASRIAAVGITGCGNGAVFLDARHRPLRAGILASDTRAASHASHAVRRGQQSYPGQLPALLAWFRARERTLAKRMAHAVFWKDFIRARLTGIVCSDYTDASASGMFVYPHRRVRRVDEVLPPLRESLSSAGAVVSSASVATGLKVGTPVFTGCIDCEATALGSGVYAPGEVSIVAGTWSINQTYVTTPPSDCGHFLVNESVEPGRWLVVEGSPGSMANFDWACRAFGGRLGAAQAVTEAARAESSDLLFFPHVPADGGAFLGLGAAHGRPEMLRAVMEGIVFAHRTHLEKLPAGGNRRRRVTLAGGAARSRFWCQLFADGLGLPIDVPRGDQLGALGAAICAGTGIGLWSSVRAAQRALVPKKLTYLPRFQPHAALNRNYARYRRLVRSLAL